MEEATRGPVEVSRQAVGLLTGRRLAKTDSQEDRGGKDSYGPQEHPSTSYAPTGAMPLKLSLS